MHCYLATCYKVTGGVRCICNFVCVHIWMKMYCQSPSLLHKESNVQRKQNFFSPGICIVLFTFSLCFPAHNVHKFREQVKEILFKQVG